MKLLFSLMVVCASLMTIAQPKKSKQILIENELSAEDNFMNVGRFLIEKGFEVDSNKDFLTLRTVEKGVSGQRSYYYYSFVFKDKSIRMFGKIRTPEIFDAYSDIENRGLNGSHMKNAFEEMLATAKQLGTVSGFE